MDTTREAIRIMHEKLPFLDDNVGMATPRPKKQEVIQASYKQSTFPANSNSPLWFFGLK